MFRGMVQALHARSTRVGALDVLRTTYNFEFQDPGQMRIMDRVASVFGDVFNEHELAIQFLADLSSTINARDPAARGKVEQYVRLAHDAYNRGLAVRAHPKDHLFIVARQRFGIDPYSVPAP